MIHFIRYKSVNPMWKEALRLLDYEVLDGWHLIRLGPLVLYWFTRRPEHDPDRRY